MSLEKIKTIFAGIEHRDDFTLQLLQIKISKNDETTYFCREISISPDGALQSFVSELSKRYTDTNKGVLNNYQDVIEYNGSTVENTVFKLDSKNNLIASEYEALMNAIASPDAEIDPLASHAQASLFRGRVVLDGKERPLKLISMQNPITSLKHKFARAEGTFKEISEKVISLRTTVDVIILDETVYMLTLAGERLFNMERAYRGVCENKIKTIQEYDIVSDSSSFSDAASRGHNPRRFVSFNDNHLEKIKKLPTRKKMSNKFNIPLIENKFDTTKPEDVEKLVKLLCNRGMLEPFDENPMEVSGSKNWT